MTSETSPASFLSLPLTLQLEILRLSIGDLPQLNQISYIRTYIFQDRLHIITCNKGQFNELDSSETFPCYDVNCDDDLQRLSTLVKDGDFLYLETWKETVTSEMFPFKLPTVITANVDNLSFYYSFTGDFNDQCVTLDETVWLRLTKWSNFHIYGSCEFKFESLDLVKLIPKLSCDLIEYAKFRNCYILQGSDTHPQHIFPCLFIIHITDCTYEAVDFLLSNSPEAQHIYVVSHPTEQPAPEVRPFPPLTRPNISNLHIKGYNRIKDLNLASDSDSGCIFVIISEYPDSVPSAATRSEHTAMELSNILCDPMTNLTLGINGLFPHFDNVQFRNLNQFTLQGFFNSTVSPSPIEARSSDIFQTVKCQNIGNIGISCLFTLTQPCFAHINELNIGNSNSKLIEDTSSIDLSQLTLPQLQTLRINTMNPALGDLNLPNLQTLELNFHNGDNIPFSFSDLIQNSNNLTHLIIKQVSNYNTSPPDTYQLLRFLTTYTAYLNIRTLTLIGVDIPEVWPDDMPNFPNLIELSLGHYCSDEAKDNTVILDGSCTLFQNVQTVTLFGTNKRRPITTIIMRDFIGLDKLTVYKSGCVFLENCPALQFIRLDYCHVIDTMQLRQMKVLTSDCPLVELRSLQISPRSCLSLESNIEIPARD
ncbi:hypothetical protein WICPIJ_005261 [Wickerhamomyces pijperi]|uniref:Uncharacterized protein n=1 Tax=Wickerhamomyces pijperi TaxID=599730 RepID=A0A9P8Q4E6_WICPI|nr:hypothetical protein WICPIJ_005261 [Wickerhamomyces pijperi]